MTQTPSSIMKAAEFETHFGALYRSIFRGGGEATRGSFVKPDWRLVLVPSERIYYEEELRQLQVAAELCGDREFIITSWDTLPPHHCSAVVPWNLEAWEKKSDESDGALLILDAAVFGQSAAWGLISIFDSACVLGGASQFIDPYIQNAGGIERMKRAFLEYARDEFDDETETQRLLSVVGWVER